MYYIQFINERDQRVTITMENYKQWLARIQKMKRSKVVTYCGCWQD